MADAINKPSEEYVEIFCRYIYKNGRRIYPKNGKSFHFYIRRK